MAQNSELGPVDSQVTLEEDGVVKRFAVFNIIESYEDLFSRAVEAQGPLEPYLQQLAHYDQREIEE